MFPEVSTVVIEYRIRIRATFVYVTVSSVMDPSSHKDPTACKATDSGREWFGVLGKPTFKAIPTAHSARETIMKAVDLLEAENADLRKLNNHMLKEMEKLQSENDRLKKELEMKDAENNKVVCKMDTIMDTNKKMHGEYEVKMVELEKQLSITAEKERKLQEETSAHSREMESVRKDMCQKENEMKRLNKDLEVMQNRFDRATRRNFNDRDIELLHELEVLKNQKREFMSEKEEMDKVNKRLRTDLANFESQMNMRDLELKNENRRHALLTKEFNSLLEENNHLKLQLRRRGNASSMTMVAEQVRDESITEIPTASDQPVNVPHNSRQHAHSYGSSRDSSIVSSYDRSQVSREYPVTARERSHKITRPLELNKLLVSRDITKMFEKLQSENLQNL